MLSPSANGLYDSYFNFVVSAKTGWNEYDMCRRKLVDVIRNSNDEKLISACSLSEKSLIRYDKNDYNMLKFLGMIEFKIGWTEENEKEVADVLNGKRNLKNLLG